MAKIKIIDSHIHLWPQETSNEAGHAWMTPGMPLAKPHLLEAYYQASHLAEEAPSEYEVEGVVYIETDVRYDSPTGDIATWAKGPLDEIAFLRRLVDGDYGKRDSKILLGLVPWAPMNHPTAVMEEFLRLAEDVAGPTAWKRVKGFRFLLQAITDKNKFEQLVFSADFIRNLKLLGRRGFSFDVGVDQHSGGTWQLFAFADAMEKAHAGVSGAEKVIFIVNHLCKPDFPGSEADFRSWSSAIEQMSRNPNVYMKLSGAFSELPSQLKSVEKIAEYIRPWLRCVFTAFGPQRVMFGSDWPVCNVRGPAGEESWTAWRDVVALVLADDTYDFGDSDKEAVWRDTAQRAYRLDLRQAI